MSACCMRAGQSQRVSSMSYEVMSFLDQLPPEGMHACLSARPVQSLHSASAYILIKAIFMGVQEHSYRCPE